jgi:hypothetical protein
MANVTQIREDELKIGSEGLMEYFVAVRRADNKEFIAGYRFEGYSGHAMMDEVRHIRQTFEKSVTYPVTVEW